MPNILSRFNIFRKINRVLRQQKFPSVIETRDIHLTMDIADHETGVSELIILHYHLPPTHSVVTIQILETLARIYSFHKLTFRTPHQIYPAYFDKLGFIQKQNHEVYKWIF